MRPLLVLPILFLCGCGEGGGKGLTVSLPAGIVTIDDSHSTDALRVSFVGGDGEATIFWSDFQPDGSKLVVGRSIGAELDLRESGNVSNGFRSSRFPSACRSERGLAVAWADAPVELPSGITLNERDVLAAMSWPSTDDSVAVHPGEIGSQNVPSLACLDNGERVVAYNHICSGVDRTGNGDFIFRPEQCETEPANGIYLRFFGLDGQPTSDAIRMDEATFFSRPVAAAAGEDRFVAVSSSGIQSWRGRELVNQRPADLPTFENSLACVQSGCVVPAGGELLVFDATDLSSLKTFIFEPTTIPGPDQRIYATSSRVACDENGLCVVTWVLERETVDYDSVLLESLGVYVAAFDLTRATLGDAVLVREPFRNDSGAVAAATEAGNFLLASATDTSLFVQRLTVDQGPPGN